MPSNDDDRQVIDSILAGDLRAREKCVQRFSDMVWRILRGSLRLSTDDAADAFQEIFLKLQEKDLHRLRQWRGPAPLEAYLFVVVRRLARDYVRAQHRDKVVQGTIPDPVDPAPTPEEVALLSERQRAVQTCQERLTVWGRQLLRLRYALDLTCKAIATHMTMTVSNVGVALSRVEARIARCLRERSPELFGDWEKGVPEVM